MIHIQGLGLIDRYTKYYAFHERWKKIFSLTLLDRCSNSVVKKCRGVKRSLDDIVVLLGTDVIENNADIDNDEEETDEEVGNKEDE